VDGPIDYIWKGGARVVKIGFVIITHNEPEQLLRLVKTLSAMFDVPPIVCHHNFSLCPLDEALFPPNVRFVHPHILTHWGHISVPSAALRALDLLRKCSELDWFVLLSGTDYPVRPADEIVAELSNANYDIFLDNREILYRGDLSDQTAQSGFGRASWNAIAYDRYCAFPVFWWPRLSIKALFSGVFPFRKERVLIRHPDMIRWLRLKRPSRIFGGAIWFQANRKAIDHLLDDPSLPMLVRYYRNRKCPEESIFHSSLCIQPDLRICKSNMRYEEWMQYEDRSIYREHPAHPRWLEASDVPKIVASGAYFARKFRPDGVAQELLDQRVLVHKK
jgi:hypothetical protein